MRMANASGKTPQDSFLETLLRMAQMLSCDGAATLIPRHRERTGSITLEALLQHKIRRQAAVYFSIVRRRAAWAWRLSLSTSVRITTLYARPPACPMAAAG